MKKLAFLLNWFKKDKKRVIAAVIVILIIGFLAWKNFSGKSTRPTYQTTKVERGTIVSTLSVSGQVASAGNMPVTTQTSGIVKNLFVKNGDIVTAGQNLFEMTPDQQSLQRQTQAWASYLSAKNNLETAKANLYNLQSDMLTQWKDYMDIAQNSTFQNADKTPNSVNRQLPEFMVPNDNWLAAEAKYKNQQGVIAQAQASLTSSWNSYQAVSPLVTAPIAGRVEDITLVLGMVITGQTTSSGNSTAQILATIKTESAPIVTFNLAEVDVTKVKADKKVTITLDALPDKTFTGKVVGVDKTGIVSQGVTNYPTTIQFDTNAPDVLTNMSATGNIILEAKNDVLTVPTTAVQTNNGQSFVRVLKNGQVTQVAVETGIASDSETEIVSGVGEGDEIITSMTTLSTSTGTGTSPFSSFGGRGGVIFGTRR